MSPATRGLAVLALVAIGSVPLAEHRFLTNTVSVDGRWDIPFFRQWTSFEPESSSRSGDKRSSLLIGGLLADARVAIDFAVATGARRPFRVAAAANGIASPAVRLGAPYRVVSLVTRSDSAGEIDVRFVPEDQGESAVRMSWFRVSHEGTGRIPRSRWLLYLLLLTLTAGIAAVVCGDLRGLLSAVAVVASLTSGALGVSRLHTLAALPGLVVALALSLALALLATRWLPRPYARWVVVVFAFRLTLVLHPAFPCIDGTFHTHNVWKFRQGQVLSSRSPSAGREAMGVPYPPALYALLSPVFGLRPPDEEVILRLVMGLLEGTAPLLVFALMRKGGASVDASGAGAVACAVMPEGILVLAKGIAANILGTWLTTLTTVSIFAGWSSPALLAIMTLTLLSHFGVTLSLLGLFGVWTSWSLFTRSSARVLSRLFVLAVALTLAWLMYYREVGSLAGGAVTTLGSNLESDPAAFLRIRWIQVGKTLQDLLLKFGATPVVLAVIGLRRRKEPGALLALLQPWILCGLLLGMFALLTPIPLRFEYFLMAPVAAAAGLGAETLSNNGKGYWVSRAWGLALVIQVAIGVLLLLGRFELISVVMESDRWPLPVRLTGPPLTY